MDRGAWWGLIHKIAESDTTEVTKQSLTVKSLSLTLSDPMDCSLPGSSAHGIFQARVLEWVAIAFSVVALSVVL